MLQRNTPPVFEYDKNLYHQDTLKIESLDVNHVTFRCNPVEDFHKLVRKSI
jgi:hypothetical protein